MIREYIIKISDEIMEEEIADRPQKLVRCENCRWWHESELEQFKGFGECGQANGIALKPHDWFCADGERKEVK